MTQRTVIIFRGPKKSSTLSEEHSTQQETPEVRQFEGCFIYNEGEPDFGVLTDEDIDTLLSTHSADRSGTV